jgi:hypothetical protein
MPKILMTTWYLLTIFLDGSFWLASGGEDNAFAVNWLDIRYDSRDDAPASAIAKADIAKIAGAHASSVTGI